MKTIIEQFNIDDIPIDETLQARVELDQDTIDAYAEEMRNGAKFPPLVLFQDGEGDEVQFWLADGWHRFKAYQQNQTSHVPVKLHQGPRRDALMYAAGANAKHGLRRTTADKRQSVAMLLRDAELVTRSDNALGKLAGVDHKTVGRIRAELELSGEIPKIAQTAFTRKGKTHTQRTKRTGKAAAPQGKQPQDNHKPKEAAGDADPPPVDQAPQKPTRPQSKGRDEALFQLLKETLDHYKDEHPDMPYTFAQVATSKLWSYCHGNKEVPLAILEKIQGRPCPQCQTVAYLRPKHRGKGWKCTLCDWQTDEAKILTELEEAARDFKRAAARFG